MAEVVLVSVGDVAEVGFDYTDALPEGVTVAVPGVTHTVPDGLTKGAEANDATTSGVMVSGFSHAGLYLIKATATLSNGETLVRSRPVRCLEGA
jgi:hypothetical protein